jgi:PhnB protein
MKIHAYLMFDGQCEDAFRFYAECLDGKLERLMRYAEAPDNACGELPAEYQQRIMHACLMVGDQLLMASDTAPPYVYEGIKGCSISLSVDSIAEAERLFAALAKQGQVQMPMQATFWATRFGMLTDRFGVSWMVGCEQDG